MCFAKGIALSGPNKRAKVPLEISQRTLVHPSLFFSEVEREERKLLLTTRVKIGIRDELEQLEKYLRSNPMRSGQGMAFNGSRDAANIPSQVS